MFLWKRKLFCEKNKIFSCSKTINMKCNFPFNVALSLAGRERVTLKETSSRPCLSLCLSAWRGRNHIVVFSECVCSLCLCLCCAACNSLSPRMVAHFAIEVAAVFPLVPDNDCLNRAHTVLSVYAGSIYSVYSFVYMPVHCALVYQRTAPFALLCCVSC